MKTFVIDASVIVKWVFPERKNEDHLSQAVNLLKAIRQNTINVIQPPHWLAEVISVIVRIQPGIYEDVINLLHIMEFQIIDTVEIYYTASHLSEMYNHHLFDTLYHSVALHHKNANLITADDRYFKKANKQGSIMHLAEFSIFD